MRILMDQRWDGNVRELRNAIDHAVIRARGSVITPDDLPAEFLEIPSQTERRAPYGGPEEREKILAALRETGGDREAAARNLGVSRATLYRRMHACQINPRGLRHHARSAAGAPLEGKEPG
jgi:two-component system response regulator HydG